MAVVLALALLFAATGEARKPRRRCHLRGTNLISSKVMKVVQVDAGDGDSLLYGCVYKVGRIRLISSINDPGLGSATMGVDSVAGTWLTVRSSLANQYGQDTSYSVVDVRDGRGYGIFYFHYDIGSPGGGPGMTRYILTGSGRVAALYTDYVVERGTTTSRPVGVSLALFLADGTKLSVDSGAPDALPPSSLSFGGRKLRWSKGGEPRELRIS
jgi:hypothetical protein